MSHFLPVCINKLETLDVLGGVGRVFFQFLRPVLWNTRAVNGWAYTCMLP